MILRAEVMENGCLRVKTPGLKAGDEVILETRDNGVRDETKGKWSELEKAFEEFDKLDIPRMTHKEILQYLAEIRGRNLDALRGREE